MDPPPPFQPPPQAVAAEVFPPPMATAPVLSNANPAPGFGTIPNHPPYAEMITAAITALKEKDGSSKKAIAKYIEVAYPNLPPAHPALLTHHLKRLKNSGQLVMVKKSYMLPPPPGSGSDPAPPFPAVSASPANFTSSPPLKRRGRPPKPKPFAAQPQPAVGRISDPSSGLGNGGVVSSKRRPGRPPKPKPAPTAAVDQQDHHHHQQPVYAAQPFSSNNAAVCDTGLVNGSAALPKRRPGRPPKYRDTSIGEQVPVSWSEVGGSNLVGGGGSNSVKRRPGRPPKYGTRPRGRPRKSDGLAAPMRQPPVGSGARGRPRKRAAVVVDGGVIAVGMKRRGRPPGIVSGARKLSIGRRGRPLGRPRKDASTVRKQASEGRAREELTRKLEYMQLKVRNAVGLLKPHLINANIIDILTALQDLEELTTMDITAPPTTVEPPTTVAPMTVPIPERTAPMTTGIAAPGVDVTAPPYAGDPGVVGQLPVGFN